MGIIPEFQQQRLASSAVGTPGVDPSAGKIAGMVSKLAGGEADRQFEIATKRDDALAAAEANRRSIEYDIEVENLRESTKVEFKDNPKQGQIEFSNRAFELFNSKLGSSENKKANRMFSAMGQATIGKEKIAYNTFRINQEAVNAKDNLVDATNMLALQANEIGKTNHSPAGLQKTFDLIDRAEVARGASDVVLGLKESQNLANMQPESIMRGHIEGAIDTNPEYALEVLKNPNVIELFPDFADITKLEESALTKIDEFDRKAEKQLTKQREKKHFNNTLQINEDPAKVSDTELVRQVEAGEISGTQAIAALKQKNAPVTRPNIEAVRAEGKRLEALGELTNVWISDNAADLSTTTINNFRDSLTTKVTSNPSYKAAIASIDAEVEEGIFGVRTTFDDKLFSDAAEAVRIAVIKENKNPMTVANEQITNIKKLKAEQLITKPANNRAKKMKRLNGGVVTPQFITEQKAKLIKRINKKQVSDDEAQTIAEAIEILEAEVNNAE